MKDSRKTKAQLIEELESLRQEVADLRSAGRLDLVGRDRGIDELLSDLRQIVYRYDIQADRFVYVSESIRSVLGIDADDINGCSQAEVLPQFVMPDEIARIRQEWIEARRKAREDAGHVAVIEYRAKGVGGEVLMQDRCRYLFDDSDTPREVLGTSTDITEIRASGERLQDTLDTAGHMLYRFNYRTDRVEYVSPGVARVLGYPLDVISNWTREDIIHRMPPEDRDVYEAVFENALANASDGVAHLNVQFRQLCQDGTYVWLDNRAVLYFDADGELSHSIGSAVDITAQRDLQQELAHTNRLIEEAIVSSQSAIYRWDAKADRLEYFGDALEEITGEPMDAICGRSMKAAVQDIHPDDRAGVQAALDAAVENSFEDRIQAEWEYRRRRSDGTYCWMRNRAMIVKDPAGQIDHVVGSIVDISAQRQTAEEIRQQRDFAESLLQTAQALVVVLDSGGHVVRLNCRLEETLGTAGQAAVGQHWSQCICAPASQSTFETRLAEVLASESSREFMAQLLTDEGVLRNVEWFCTPLKGQQSDVTGILMMGRDVTELREHEVMRDALVEAIPDMMFRYTREGVISDYYPGTGVDPYVKPTAFLGLHIGDVLPEDVARQILDAINTCVANRDVVTIEYTLDMPDGEHVYEGRFVCAGENDVLNIVRDISESRRTAERLRLSEKNLRAFIDALPDIAIVLDAEGRYVEAYADNTLLYRPPRDLLGKRMADVLPPDVAAGALAAITRTLESGESQVFEYELDVPAGHRWFEGRTAPFLVGDSANAYVIWMARDVTDRHEARQALQAAYDELEARVAARTEALRQSEQHERLFSEQLRRLQEVNAILGQIEDVDELCRRTVELSRERLGFGRVSIWFLDKDKRHTLGTFGTDKDGNLVDERRARLSITHEHMRDQAVLDGRIPLGVYENIPLRDATTRVVGQGTMASAGMWDGTEVIGKITTDDLLEGSSLPAPQLEILRLLGVTVGHLCTRTRAEEALQASEERYRQLVESTADMVWACDLQGRITFVNSAVRSMLGLEPEEAVGHYSFEWMQADDQEDARRVFERALREKTGWSGVRTRFVHRDGSTRYIESMGRPVLNSTGEIIGFSGIDRDITQRREAEEALRRAHLELINAREKERRVLAKELHDSVAQDLVVLQLTVSSLRQQREDAESMSRQISEKLGESITEIRRICHGLYPPMLESLGLSHALAYLSDLYCGAERTVTFECSEVCAKMRFSPEVEITLYRIAQEATSNAIRHGHAAGVELRLFMDDGLVHLEVEDDGEGFEPGGTNKLGLGLQSMKDRATSVDGSLTIESQIGRTVVSVCVPREHEGDA